MPKKSQAAIRAKIEALYKKCDSTSDPDEIREYGKQIAELEAVLQRRGRKER